MMATPQYSFAFSFPTTGSGALANFTIELYFEDGKYFSHVRWTSGAVDGIDIHGLWHAFVDSNPNVPNFSTTYGQLHTPARYYAQGGGAAINDVIIGGDGGGGIFTWGGADTITATVRPGQVEGDDGNDEGGEAHVGHAEWHIYAGRGNDKINMDFSGVNSAYSMGHHVKGDLDEATTTYDVQYADTYDFVNINDVGAGEVVVGRFDDFETTRDILKIDGVAITDLNAPPVLASGVSYKIVRHVGQLGDYNGDGIVNSAIVNGIADDTSFETQLWLVITTASGGHIVYALEDDRVRMLQGTTGGRLTEPHFVSSATAAAIIAASATTFVDPQNEIPAGETVEAGGLFMNDNDGTVSDVTAVINGTAFGDRIAAGVNNDVVAANAGNDKVWGGGGADTVNGGTENDTILGGFGNDSLMGDAGHDQVSGELGNDALFGGTGNDQLFGGDGTDVLDGGAGADVLNGGSGADTASYATATAGVRADLTTPATNTGFAAGDSFVGIENLTGSAYNDVLIGNTGNNALTGGQGSDAVYGGAGNDTITYHAGADTVDGGTGTDTLVFAGTTAVSISLQSVTNNLSLVVTGIENLTGGGTDDSLAGDGGANVLIGNDGNDSMTGWAGNDSIYGGNGADYLGGLGGDDLLSGGAGNDTLQGGAGIDQLTGGSGSDHFRFIELTEIGDTIADFTDTQDLIYIRVSGFGAGLTAGTLTSAKFWAGATNAAHDLDDRFILRSGDKTLWFDADGNASGAAPVMVANLQDTLTGFNHLDIILY